MHVPHAIDVDGQIITMFDPVTHQPIAGRLGPGERDRSAPRDRRWEKIRRPVVVVGGELTLEMLDLTFNPIAQVLRGADPAEGQRRRVRRRRLRPAAHAARAIC